MANQVPSLLPLDGSTIPTPPLNPRPAGVLFRRHGTWAVAPRPSVETDRGHQVDQILTTQATQAYQSLLGVISECHTQQVKMVRELSHPKFV